MHRPGRPTKLNPKTARAALKAIRLGQTRAEAARAAGVATSTLMAWLERGRQGEPGFRDFLVRFERADLAAREERWARAQAALPASLSSRLR